VQVGAGAPARAAMFAGVPRLMIEKRLDWLGGGQI
jgi:hypothetical protein